MPFLEHFLNLHQKWRACLDLDVEPTPDMENYSSTKSSGSLRRLEYREIAVINEEHISDIVMTKLQITDGGICHLDFFKLLPLTTPTLMVS